jgi:DNA-binding LytR/AlgR family response regulator
MRIVIADDELHARNHLRWLLEQHTDIAIVGEAANGMETVRLTEELAPDALLLDIQMPELTGLQVIEQLPPIQAIVFVTAFDQYAVRAFEAQAVDYLLKPVSQERLTESLRRIRERRILGGIEPASLRRLLEELERSRVQRPTRIAVRKKDGRLLLPLKDIFYFGIQRTLVFANTAEGKYCCDRTLGELESFLATESFFRTSRSELVNLECVVEIVPWFAGTLKLVLVNGTEIEVSREKSRQLRKQYNL